jgi:hypothetical protein
MYAEQREFEPSITSEGGEREKAMSESGASRTKVSTRPATAGERRPPVVRPGASSSTAAVPAAVSIDLSRVAWSVDFTLNGISLRDVYAEEVPQPFISPHPKAIAATALCRKYASPNPSARYDAKVILHWPSELLGEGQSLTVKPQDRLSVLIKASYLPLGAATAKNSALAGARARLGLLTPRLPAMLRKRSPSKNATQVGSGGQAGAAIQQGRRFFTKDVMVQVPEHPMVGACKTTAASERGATFTHADRASYVLVLRKLDSLRQAMRSAGQRAGEHDDDDDDDDDEDREPYCVDSLTVAIPLDQIGLEFRRVIGGVEVSEEDAGPFNRLAFEMVRNLDTGEMIHVSEVAERVPQGVKPEAMHWLSEEEEKVRRAGCRSACPHRAARSALPPPPLASRSACPSELALLPRSLDARARDPPPCTMRRARFRPGWPRRDPVHLDHGGGGPVRAPPPLALYARKRGGGRERAADDHARPLRARLHRPAAGEPRARGRGLAPPAAPARPPHGPDARRAARRERRRRGRARRRRARRGRGAHADVGRHLGGDVRDVLPRDARRPARLRGHEHGLLGRGIDLAAAARRGRKRPRARAGLLRRRARGRGEARRGAAMRAAGHAHGRHPRAVALRAEERPL